ncbi:MAG TPA: NADH-ubiquinone oxidoreductase-F iron-sulfur binding region domain-containing protein [Acidimicrobiales bacterium]|nr:NADH-ubiquinone oxidoreductase-F iron-sulfur binding region domain-containing protein [Acidimicrobiales bacterium]
MTGNAVDVAGAPARPQGPSEAGVHGAARPGPAPGAGPCPVGHPRARLLAGPGREEGAEAFEVHLRRLGALPDGLPSDAAGLAEVIEASGLAGRGGGGFGVARKLRAARQAGIRPLLIVNAAESEPASGKDGALCELRPHVVLDGAAVAAAVLGTDEAVLYTHRGATGVARALREAVRERSAAGSADPRWLLAAAPDRYVAGEASAAASFVSGGDARPRFLTRPLALAGVDGRPTVVHNAETVAHLALLARYGAEWWRRAGTPAHPGSRLVTVAGAVGAPGTVLEVVEPTPIGALLSAAGAAGPPLAVLVGGYAGRWLAGDTAWLTDFEPDALRAAGATVGCGLLAVLGHGACPLTETAGLASYLAGESAGQCGPCVFGLADVAESLHELAEGRAGRRDVTRLRRQLEALPGRGGCNHPDGVAAMVSSALEVFADEVVRHTRGRPCPRPDRRGAFPVPPRCAEWR